MTLPAGCSPRRRAVRNRSVLIFIWSYSIPIVRQVGSGVKASSNQNILLVELKNKAAIVNANAVDVAGFPDTTYNNLENVSKFFHLFYMAMP